jgi:hypothetical protein
MIEKILSAYRNSAIIFLNITVALVLLNLVVAQMDISSDAQQLNRVSQKYGLASLSSVYPDFSEDELSDTVALPESEAVSTDNVGDVSVEINVEQLIADIESEDEEEVAKKKAVRLKLEELAEDKSFEDTYAVEFDPE